jgi:hypothetical protein
LKIIDSPKNGTVNKKRPLSRALALVLPLTRVFFIIKLSVGKGGISAEMQKNPFSLSYNILKKLTKSSTKTKRTPQKVTSFTPQRWGVGGVWSKGARAKRKFLIFCAFAILVRLIQVAKLEGEVLSDSEKTPTTSSKSAAAQGSQGLPKATCEALDLVLAFAC